MTPSGLEVMLVMAGGAVGAVGRALLARWMVVPQAGWPWPTFVANVLASLLAGVVAAVASGGWRLFLLAGLCGALSTYSTFALEVVRLGRSGGPRGNGLALGYLVVSVLACVAAATIGGVLAS